MSPRPMRVVTGPEASKAAHALMKKRESREDWPFPWLFPSRGAEPVFRSNSIVAPVAGVASEILAYAIPAGLQFALVELIQVYVGSGFVAGSGSILWTVDVDQPVGVPSLQGNPLPGLNLVSLPLGGFQGGVFAPWRFAKPFLIGPEQVLRSKCITTVDIPAGAPNYLLSIFSGWTWPAGE